MQCYQSQLFVMDLHTHAENQSDERQWASSASESTWPGGRDPLRSSVHRASSSGTSPPVVVDDELRCRYANKKCTNRRTAKRTGGLHTFCDEHRENANRNQRRLDRKKRLEKRQKESLQSYYDTLQATTQYSDPAARTHAHAAQGQSVSVGTLPPPAIVEPYNRPAELLEEDVDLLLSLFGSSDQGDSKLGDSEQYES